MPDDSRHLVYSTDGSHLPKDIEPSKTRLRLRLESKGRKGKAVTVVFDLPPHPTYFLGLLRELKGHCGAGGAIKNDTIEIQGDQRDKIQAYLERKGFPVVRAGG